MLDKIAVGSPAPVQGYLLNQVSNTAEGAKINELGAGKVT